MTVQHKIYSWWGGDDWRYFIRLTDQDDQPYDLDHVEKIKWLLHNPLGEIVEHDYLISKLEAQDGRLSIWIPSSETTNFVAGVWTDFVRIVCDGITSTLLTGPISVTADPWRANVADAPFGIERGAAIDHTPAVAELGGAAIEHTSAVIGGLTDPARAQGRSTADVVVMLSPQERIVRRRRGRRPE